jgi:hypothetical protein
MSVPTLDDLVEALRPITRRVGPLTALELAELDAFLSLSAYAGAPDPPAILLQDLVAAVHALPANDDRIIAQYLFRQRGEALEIGKRRATAIKDAHVGNPRQVRGDREDYIIGQVAFALYAGLASPLRAGSPMGDGYVFSRLEIDTFVHDDGTTCTKRYTFSIHTVRAMVEFYKFGTPFRRSEIIEYRHIADGRQQRLVGTTPVDVAKPDDAHWYIVQFAPQLPFRTDETVVIEEDVRWTGGDARTQAAELHVAGLTPIARMFGVAQSALLRVHAPRSLVTAYSRNLYSARAVTLGRPDSTETVEREDDSPMAYDIKQLQADTRYELAWRITA